jgi:RNA polymerase sigma-70 factor (ECF subfamily)
VLFGRNGKAAKIGLFLGRGRLVDWLRTVTRREALQHLRVRGRMVEFEDSGPLESGDAITDMELGHLQQVYRDQFREAFAEAMASLSPKERVILRFKVIDGLNIEQIGRMNGVHRATVARWLAAARRKLLKQTRARLMHDAGLSPSEFESVTRLVRSQLDLSVGRLLDAPS